MEIKLKNKFAEKDISEFTSLIYNNYTKNPKDHYTFDLSESEWISNQNLLLFTSTLKYFYNNDINFKVNFIKKGISTDSLSIRTKLQIVQIWEIWEIYSVIGRQDYSEYFDITNNTINAFKQELIKKGRYNEKNKEIFDRYEITPFITLQRIDNYTDDKLLELEIEPVFSLNSVISEKLKENDCFHPFISNILSSIITKELYENFLDHSEKSFFKSQNDWAFMSLALRPKLKSDNQTILRQNFDDEEIPETIQFFKNKDLYKNESFIQFSFLDFGKGIISSLQNQYNKEKGNENDNLFSNPDPNDILRYAFKHYTSKNPIKINDEKDLIIPRGLFDLLTIVKRYNGLIIIRSNYGKIIYNFSETQDIDNAFSTFGENADYFPGTFITIYLPALLDESKFDKSTIKPAFSIKNKNIEAVNYINIFTLTKNIYDKKFIYNNFIKSLKKSINRDSDKNKLNFISFLGCKDKRIIQKTIFYLLTDYDINIKNSVVILHPPSKEILQDINKEILNLNSVLKDFKIHPIPFIYFENKDNIQIEWVGLYNDKDKNILNKYILDGVSFPITDFQEPHNITGNLQSFDKHGNVISQMPKKEEIVKYYNIYSTIDDILIEDIILKHNCLKQGLYLCNGNYYQHNFLHLIDLLNNENDCKEIAGLLFEKIKSQNTEYESIHYIAVTSSSHKILNSFIKQGFIKEENCVFFDDYRFFDIIQNTQKIKSGINYILLCDAISAGSLVSKVADMIKNNKSSLKKIAVIANTIDEDFEGTNDLLRNYKEDIIHLYRFPIKKYRRNQIENKESLKEVIRINPYTNIPITFSEKLTLRETILLNINDINKYIDNDDININFKIFNNLIHPYFFNLKNILKKENDNIKSNNQSILKKIFEKLKTKVEIDKNLKIFYPKNSDIKILDFDILKSKVLYDQSIEIYELERFNTSEGWIFPHTTDFYSEIIENKNILILDDGSCSGDSLLQMINEISYFKPKKIDLICLIGRVRDHKREFFSKINSLKYINNQIDNSSNINYNSTNINIYFGSYWHIPTFYLEDSPYSVEISWIKELLKIQNTPLSIKNIAQSILKEISPEKDKKNDYKYFPKQRNNNQVPKKEILTVRNEIGKITGYRFYKESFRWFNEFITKYEIKRKTPDRTKEIELLAMCLLYEPYLYERISNILPDIREKVEEFLDLLIFGNSKNQFKKLNLDNYFFYDWSKNKRDILHLFFIIYKGDNLINKLTLENFTKLIEFSKDTFTKINPINYIFYKILSLFPLNNSNSVYSNYTKIKDFLYNIIENNSFNQQITNDLKRFYSFINTLPNKEELELQINEIKNLYWEHEQPKLHDSRDSFDQNISKTITSLNELKDICEENSTLDVQKMAIVKESWWAIKHLFLNKIISFYRTYEDFFKPYPYHLILSKLENKASSLIEMYSFLDEFIFNIQQKANDVRNYKKSIEFLEIIQNNFGLESEFRNIFEQYGISFNKFREELIKEIELVNNNLIIENDVKIDMDIKMPLLYIKKLLIKEIKDNIDFYSDKRREVYLSIFEEIENNYIVVEIKNYYNDNVKEFGGGEGLNSIKLLSKCDLFYFNFNYNVNNKEKLFKLNLIFEK